MNRLSQHQLRAFGKPFRDVGVNALQIISERELTFPFNVVVRPSVCLSVVCRLSVTFVHGAPTQAIEIFRNVSTPFGTLAIC